MSDLPPLPETNDPHELLGVAEDADEMTLKRAYLRLIRVYRPERAPAEFQRVHKAYEQAREYLRWNSWLTSDDPVPEIEALSEAEQADPDTARAARDEPIREAWMQLAHGDADGARAQIHRAALERPECVRTHVHLVLIEEAAEPQSTARSAGPLVALLDRQPAVGTWITTALQPEDVAPALTGRTARWERLRALADRNVARRLLRRRWHTMLLEAQVDTVHAEVLAPQLHEDALEDPWLADVALAVALASVWEDPRLAEGLVKEHGHDASFDDGGISAQDQYYFIKLEELDRAYRHATTWDAFPPTLQMWFTLWPILDPDALRHLARRLFGELVAHPDTYLQAFDRLVSAGPPLVLRHIASIQHIGISRDADIPLLQRARVRDTLESMASHLTRAGVKAIRRSYKEGARPVLLDLIVAQALSPNHIAWWFKKELRGAAHRAFARHVEALEGDLGLQAIYWTSRLRELPPQELRV